MAFEQIYQILQVLDEYLIDNPQQHDTACPLIVDICC